MGFVCYKGGMVLLLVKFLLMVYFGYLLFLGVVIGIVLCGLFGISF